MRTLLLFCALLLSPVIQTTQAAPKKSVKAPALKPLTLRNAKAPLTLVKRLGGAKILRSGMAPLGPKRESCWALWIQTKPAEGRESEILFSVWKPTGKNRWLKVGDWPLDVYPEFGGADLAWLNSKTQTGWVMLLPGESTRLVVWPQGAATKRGGLISESFEGSATSIYATYYEFGADKDKRGFYTVTKIYSEPGMNDKGETITVNERTVYYWNGSGWGGD